MNQKTILVALTLLLTPTLAALAQDKEPPACRVRVHVVKHKWDDPAQLQPNSLSHNQFDWWEKSGKKKFPGVCFVNADQEADYLLSWSEKAVTHRITLTVPTTSTHSGTVQTNDGRSATYSGSSTTMEKREQEVLHWWVQLRVNKLSDGKPALMPVLTDERVGRRHWSKPDKDAFERAIKKLAK